MNLTGCNIEDLISCCGWECVAVDFNTAWPSYGCDGCTLRCFGHRAAALWCWVRAFVLFSATWLTENVRTLTMQIILLFKAA